jgi:FMN phosphatase YigB (HAD superfamily)
MAYDHKVILTDIDGVVFDWHTQFVNWMEMQGYKSTGMKHHDADIHLEFGIDYKEALVKKEEFNTNMISSTLEPYGEADIWINKLYEEDYRFIGLTSFSDKPIAQYYRYLNLEDYFPTDCFASMIFLSPGETKREVLEQFSATNLIYVEDRILNVNSALRLGLKPILMSHEYNIHFKRDPVFVANDWKQIYNYIKNQ